ncbi:MAG: efflux RND transporter periplasmic adaptor subunit [Bacteriovoracaceae bacterium]
MTTQKKIILFSIPTIIIIALAIFFFKKNNSGDWVKLRESSITDAIYGLATLESEDTFRFRVGVTSQIKKLYVKEGDNVKKGETLLQLAEGAIIKTPIDGVVTQLDTKENENIFPNANLITVMNLNKMSLAITLEQASAIRVRAGLPTRIQFESMKGTPIDGIVRSIYPKDGQFLIKVDLKNTPPSVLPGMTADTAIIAGEKANALLAPIRSIHRGMITIRKDGKTKKVHVNIGFQDSEYIELIDSPDMKLDQSMEVWVSKK